MDTKRSGKLNGQRGLQKQVRTPKGGCWSRLDGSTKRTVVVMLVRAVGVVPLWKDSTAFCMAGSRVFTRGGFGVCCGSVAVYMVECILWAALFIFAAEFVESRQQP